MSERSEQLQSILVAYIEAAEKGQAPRREELLAQHPDFAAELAEFLDGRERIQRVAPPAGEMPTMAPSEMPAAPLGTVRYFGDYELLAEIARGGMGVVYRARQVSLNRTVALKMILSGQLAGAEDVRRFTLEAEAAANLDHPNIVPIYEVGEHNGQHYFSMKLVEGGSLAATRSAGVPPAERNAGGTPALQRVAKLVATVARAVHHAHQRGILHRDLKPGNILLDAQGEPHVTDFGLSRKIDGDGQLTQSGAIVGTPSYMAPEQASAKKGLTIAVDVYALGAILYEMLTGQPPFRAATPLDTLLQVVDRDPEPPRRLNPSLDRDLETICLKCLAKEPAKRYESAAALADDLERWQRGEPIVARPAGTLEKAIKWARRRPALAALAATILVAATALLVVGLIYNARLQHALGEVAEQKAAVVQTRAAADEMLGDARRTQERIAYMRDIDSARREIDNGYSSRAEDLLDRYANSPARGWEWYYLKRLCHREARSLPGARAVAWSADGKLLATATPGVQFEGQREGPGAWADVHILDAADGRLIRTLPGDGHYVDLLAFNQNGARLLMRRDGERLEVWDVPTGRLLQGWKVPAALDAVAIRRDGKQVATASDDTVSLWDVETGQLDRKFSYRPVGAEYSSQSLRCLEYSPDGTRLAVGTVYKSVILFETATGKQERLLSVDATVGCLAFSNDGGRLTAGSEEGIITSWGLKGGAPPRTFPAHQGRVNRLAISPSGQRIASHGEDRALRLWSVGGKEQTFWWTDDAWVTSLAFGPDEDRLTTISQDGPIRFWEVGRPSPIKIDGRHYAVGPDGRRFVVGSSGTVDKQGNERIELCEARICDGATGQVMHIVDQTRHPPEDGIFWHKRVVLSPDGRRLATCDVPWSGNDKARGRQTVRPTIRIWDAETGALLFSLEQAGEAVAFSADGRWIATLITANLGLSAVEPVRLWDARDGKLLGSYRQFTPRAETLTFSPDGRQLAVAGGSVWLLDVSTDGLRLASVLPERASSVAFSPDGGILATTDWPGDVTLWNSGTGRLIREIKQRRRSGVSNPDQPSYLAFTPDGRRLAYATDHETVRLLDVESGHDLLVLEGTRDAHQMERIFFSTDGQRLFGVEQYGKFHVWDATPLPEDIRCEHLALARVQSLGREVIPRDEVVQRLRDDATLDDGTRRAALRLAETIEDRADRFNDAAWAVVVSPGAGSAACEKALRQTEYACRLASTDADYQHTRAAALYRLGRYEGALDALRLTTSLRPAAERDSHYEDLAFLAMTCERLGRKDEARDYLKRMREVRETNIEIGVSFLLLREAEELIEGQGASPK